jgi:hypothetical protein
MAVVLIDFDLPDFQDSFTWEGDQSTAKQTAEGVRQMAVRAGYDPPDEYLRRTVIQAPLLLNDPRTRDAAKTVIAGFVLQLPTEDTEHPGVVGDYLAAHDVAVVICEIEGRFTCRVGFTLQKDIVGTA